MPGGGVGRGGVGRGEGVGGGIVTCKNYWHLQHF